MTDGQRSADATPPASGTPPIFRPPPPPARTSRSAPAARPEPPPTDADPRRGSYERLPALPPDVTAPLAEELNAPQPEAATVPLPADPALPQTAEATTPEDDPIVAQWVHVVPERRREGLGGFALTLAILALVASFFVGWAAPVALVAIIVAAVAMRRPQESRPVAAWALALGLLAFVYSAGWLVWTGFQLGLFG